MSMANAIAARLDGIQSMARISDREVSDLIRTRPETISRWRTGKSEPQQRSLESLLKLEWLVGQLSELYSPDDAKLWLYSPHKLLDGDRPADRIIDDRLDDVLKVIAQLKDGAYA